MVQGCAAGGSDGTDRDTTDATYDAAAEFFSGNTSTFSTSKLDYLAWWDSVASPARMVIFNSSPIPSGKYPPELLNYPNPVLASGAASDHRPVIVDFILPLAEPEPPGDFDLVFPGDGATDVSRLATLSWNASSNAETYTVRVATDPTMTDLVVDEADLTDTSYPLQAGQLQPCTTYYWGVTAFNASGERDSTPHPAAFETHGVADMNDDGRYDTLDFLVFLNYFAGGHPEADLNLDGKVDTLDFLFFLNNWTAGC